MKNNVFIQKAIQSLGGQTIYKVDPKTLDIILIKSDHSKEQLQQEANRIEEEWNQNKYQRDRKLEYPTIEELVVALYDESDKASIIERRNAVKAKYPKPE